MCTVFLGAGRHPGQGVLWLAGTRDESPSRWTAPPQLLRPGVVGGKDLAAGGTWLGFTSGGLVLGVVNRWVGRHPQGKPLGERESRGVLALRLLASSSLDEARRLLVEEAQPGRFNPCFVFMGGRTEGWWVAAVSENAVRWHRPRLLAVLSNRGLMGGETLRWWRREAAEHRLGPGPKLAGSARTILRRHGQPPWAGLLAGPCRRPPGGHRPDALFGTVSATVAQWDEEGRLDYRYAAGPPCLTPWQRVRAPLLEAGITPG